MFKSLWGNTARINIDNGLESIFNFCINKNEFVIADIEATYTKILTDVVERCAGIPESISPMLWDSCLQNEAQYGLISMLVKAMVNRTDLFIVYIPSVKIVREATEAEKKQIQADYKKDGESKTGVFVSFKNYRRTKMLNIYSELEYFSLCSLNKTMNLSKAIQVKVKELRSSVSNEDAPIAEAQARSIAKALGDGKDVMVDAEDEITTAAPSVDATKAAISFLDSKRAYILSLPLSYVSGEQTGGIGSTGEADMRAVERGLLQYFVSIVQPVLKAVFNISVKFRSQDTRWILAAMEVLKGMELTTDSNLMSDETKMGIIAVVFNLNKDEEKKLIEAQKKLREERLENGRNEFNEQNGLDNE